MSHPIRRSKSSTRTYSGEASEDLSLEAPAAAHFSRIPDDTHVKSPNIRFDAH
jgi:hypothetical protein